MDYHRIAQEVRQDIVRMHYRANASHIGSALSCVDILTVLYFAVLRVDPKNPEMTDRDHFILSKGHGASALYATLSRRGFFPGELLDEYYQDGSNLVGHVTRGCVPGVEVSTGSLGHGLSIGAGIALARRHDRVAARTWVVLSDGECNEGAVWEAAMFAAQHRLDALTAVIDYNKLQAFGRTSEVMELEPFRQKWEAFGWSVEEIDGHNYADIRGACERSPFVPGRPAVIIAHTVKGKGISFMENQLAWHYRSPSEAEYRSALTELQLP